MDLESKLKKDLADLKELSGQQKIQIANGAKISMTTLYDYINGNVVKLPIANKILSEFKKLSKQKS